MQSKAAHLFRFGRVGRAAEERREVLDPLHVVMLGLRRQLADRHIFDHAPAERADGLVGHGEAPVWSEGCNSSSSDRTRLLISPHTAHLAAEPYRACGLVLWHNVEIPRCPLSGRYQGHSVDVK